MEPSDRYRLSVAWILMLVYTLNFMDRQVLSVLLPQIQEEFGVGDGVAGLLHGTAFALFYVTLALPIARWADVGNRVRIIALATFVWGAMTALCGLARTFPMLFLARVGVGVGEAGCSPAAYSLLSSYFPAERRPGALAIYGAGLPIGSALGLGVGGLLAQHMSWREVFLIFGAPSVLMAAVLLFYVREPPRPAAATQEKAPGMLGVARELWRRRSFRHATWATALLAFGGFGNGAWAPSFLIRTHDMPVALVGISLAVLMLMSAAPAALIGGRLGDRLARVHPHWQMRIPAIAMALAVPFSLAALVLPAGQIGGAPAYVFVLALSLLPTAASAVYFGPVLAAVQSMVREPMRATTMAIFLFVTNLIGMGAGPFLIGAISDLSRQAFGEDSLRWALLAPIVANALAAAHYWRAGHFVAEDLQPEARAARA